ncbi:hypothetical protein STXM2123_4820 [Streptomyces sp. F-3]|nr:hypothetical protein STXM2123_4820 [Streptomyces sp. F-3]
MSSKPRQRCTVTAPRRTCGPCRLVRLVRLGVRLAACPQV